MLQDSYTWGTTVPQLVTESSEVAELAAAHQDHLARCRGAMESRQRLGVATGLTAVLTGSTPDEAWALLVGLSRQANVKVREVGRLVVQAYGGELDAQDRIVADRLRAHLPRGSRLLRPGAASPGS